MIYSSVNLKIMFLLKSHWLYKLPSILEHVGQNFWIILCCITKSLLHLESIEFHELAQEEIEMFNVNIPKTSFSTYHMILKHLYI